MNNGESLGSLTMRLCFRTMDRVVHVNGTRNRKNRLAAAGIALGEMVRVGTASTRLPGGWRIGWLDQVTDREDTQGGSQSEGMEWRAEWDVEKRGECPFPSSADLPVPGIESTSPAFAGRFFTAEPREKPCLMITKSLNRLCTRSLNHWRSFKCTWSLLNSTS